MKLLGERIRDCRKKMSMTQEELAGEELTKSFISQVELGKVVPSIKALLVIAKRLGKKPGCFLDDLDS